jgi:hypothetical protein
MGAKAIRKILSEKIHFGQQFQINDFLEWKSGVGTVNFHLNFLQK